MKQSPPGSARCATEACWARVPGGDLGAAAWGSVPGGLGTCHGNHTLLSLIDPSGMQGELCLSFLSSWPIGPELTHRLHREAQLPALPWVSGTLRSYPPSPSVPPTGPVGPGLPSWMEASSCQAMWTPVSLSREAQGGQGAVSVCTAHNSVTLDKPFIQTLNPDGGGGGGGLLKKLQFLNLVIQQIFLSVCCEQHVLGMEGAAVNTTGASPALQDARHPRDMVASSELLL